MNTAVVTSAPVIMTSPPSEHPVVAHKGTMRGIGITGILIGLYAVGFGIYFWCVTGASSYGSSYEQDIIRAYGWMYVCSGIWFVVCGSLAAAVGCNPNRCLITGGIVVAILASLVAFGLMIREAYITTYLMSACQGLSVCGEGSVIGSMIAHGGLAVLSFIEFVLVIVHASYNCACCGKTYGPPTASSMTVMTTAAPMMQPVGYGKGYAPLHNEYDGGFPQAKVQHQTYPPPYQ